jgi:Apea-like HEPN
MFWVLLSVFGKVLIMLTNLELFRKSKQGKNMLGFLMSILKGIEIIDKTQLKVKEGSYRITTSYSIKVSRDVYLAVNIGWNESSLEKLEIVAEKYIGCINELSNGDRDSFCDTITDVIKNSLTKTDIFDIDKITDDDCNFFSILASTNPIESIERLFDLIYYKLTTSLADWLTIFELPKIQSSSFAIVSEGISLISTDDTTIWQNVASNYKGAEKWYAERNSPDFVARFKNSTWLFCQANGTSEGAKKISARRMRSFLSVMFTFLQPTDNLLDFVRKPTNDYCFQFCSKSSGSNKTTVNSYIGNLFPPTAANIEFTHDTFSQISDWYKKRDGLSPEKLKRVNTASQFINYGINSKSLERFIYFFIALDSLYGERNKVEKNITDAITNLFASEPIWQYKISRLFDLRSELVHGGCSSINEWTELDNYRKHTKSHPERDIVTAIFTAFKAI